MGKNSISRIEGIPTAKRLSSHQQFGHSQNKKDFHIFWLFLDFFFSNSSKNRRSDKNCPDLPTWQDTQYRCTYTCQYSNCQVFCVPKYHRIKIYVSFSRGQDRARLIKKSNFIRGAILKEVAYQPSLRWVIIKIEFVINVVGQRIQNGN